MKKKLDNRLKDYIKSLNSQSHKKNTLSKIGFSSTAALAALLTTPVELTSQMVCGNLGAPTRTAGSCIGGAGNLGDIYTNYCSKFDFDGDGTNELQVRYYNYSGVYPAGYMYVDPLLGSELWSMRIDSYFGDSFPAYPVYSSVNYTPRYSNHVYIVPLSSGSGYGFIAFDTKFYSFANGNHTGTHPVTGQPICCFAYGTATLWGADTGISTSDFVAISDDMTVCTNISPVLPVEFSSFDVIAKEDAIMLEWTTELEVNNAGFAVERSTDGNNYKEISFIEGQGESTETTYYSFNDENVEEGVQYYYRLRQIDYDGRYGFSNIKSIQLSLKKEDINIYPNPTNTNLVTLRFADEQSIQIDVKVYNISGELVYDAGVMALESSIDLDLSNLSNGIYFLSVRKNNRAFYEKLVLNRG